MSDTDRDKPRLQVGDIVGRKYEWSDETLHATVEAAYLDDWQRVVDAGLWRVVRTTEGELK